MSENVQRRYFSRNEAATYLGVNPRTIDRMLAARRVPHTKLGRRVLIDVHDLDTYVQASKTKVA